MSKLGPYQKHWAFTVWPGHLINHSNLEEWEAFAKTKTDGVRYVVWQHELGKEGGHHIQGFITMSLKKRASYLGNLFQLKPESFQAKKPAATPADNRAYCTDESKRLEGTEPYEFGEIPRTAEQMAPKLETFVDTMKTQGLKRAIEADPVTYIRNCNGIKDYDRVLKRQRVEQQVIRSVEVIVVWGDAGSGKSHWATTWDTPDNCYEVPDIKRGERLNLDGYNGERTIILEDYDGQIDYRTFLRMLDKYRVDFHTKGGMVPAEWDTVIITSNINPNQWYGNDKDPWYYEEGKVGPLQRRLSWIMRDEGIYPNSKVIHPDGVEHTFDELSKRVDLERYYQEEAEAFVRDNPPTEPDAGGDASAPMPSVQNPEDVTVEELLQEWEQQDEAEANTFDCTGATRGNAISDAILFDEGGEEPAGEWTHF